VRLLDVGTQEAFEAMGQRAQAALRHLGRRGDLGEEDEVIVRDVRHHHDVLGGRVLARVEVAHGGGGRLEYVVELLPAVDLLDLLVPHEVDVEYGQLAAVLEQVAGTLDHDGQGREAGQLVVEQLFVADELRGFFLFAHGADTSRALARDLDAGLHLVGGRGQQQPLVRFRELVRAARNGVARCDDQCGAAAPGIRPQPAQVGAGIQLDDHEVRACRSGVLRRARVDQLGAELAGGFLERGFECGVHDVRENPQAPASHAFRLRSTRLPSSSSLIGFTR
jgi:hypothetical protein